MTNKASTDMEVGPASPARAVPLPACGPGGRQTGSAPTSSDGDSTASEVFQAAGCQNATTALF